MKHEKPGVARVLLILLSCAATVTIAGALVMEVRSIDAGKKGLDSVQNTYERGVERIKADAEAEGRLTPEEDILVEEEPREAVSVRIREMSPTCLEVRALKERNPDIVGWIRISGTKVDYPVMYREGDSEYYLSHDFYGKDSRMGLPTVDGRTDRSFTTSNLLIHGHNITSGGVFGELDRYLDESFLYRHDIIDLYTEDEHRSFQVIAVVIAGAGGEEDGFSFYADTELTDEESFTDFVDHAKELSVHRIAATAIPGNRLITLSTCEYTREDGRLAIIARQIS